MAPVNDRLASALAITADGSQVLDLSTATGMESDESWWWGSPAYSVWYVWRPTVHSWLTLTCDLTTSGIFVWQDLVSPDDDLVALAATTVDGGPLHHLDFTYPELGGRTQRQLVEGQAGHTYLIFVANWFDVAPATEPVTVGWTVKAYNPGPWQPGGTGVDDRGQANNEDHSGVVNSSVSTADAWATLLTGAAVTTYQFLGTAASRVATGTTGTTPPYFASLAEAFCAMYLQSTASILSLLTPAGLDPTRPWQWDPAATAPLSVAALSVKPTHWVAGQLDCEARIFGPSTYMGDATLDASHTGKSYTDTAHGHHLMPQWFDPAAWNALPLVHTWPYSDASVVAVDPADIVTTDTQLIMAGYDDRVVLIASMPAGQFTATAPSGSKSTTANFDLAVTYELPRWRYLDDVAVVVGNLTGVFDDQETRFVSHQ